MAKQSIIVRNRKRFHIASRMLKKRLSWKEDLRKNQFPTEIIIKLQKRSRDESMSRVRSRCFQCGRGHGTVKKFGLCRIHLREAVMRGDVPGMRKASW